MPSSRLRNLIYVVLAVVMENWKYDLVVCDGVIMQFVLWFLKLLAEQLVSGFVMN